MNFLMQVILKNLFFGNLAIRISGKLTHITLTYTNLKMSSLNFLWTYASVCLQVRINRRTMIHSIVARYPEKIVTISHFILIYYTYYQLIYSNCSNTSLYLLLYFFNFDRGTSLPQAIIMEVVQIYVVCSSVAMNKIYKFHSTNTFM